MSRSVTIFLVLLLAMASESPISMGGRPCRADDEMKKHLEDLRRQVEDPRIDLARRERMALEIAAAHDRTGQAAGTAEEQRSRWSEAVHVLDLFNRQNPGHPRAREFDFQAAVYSWARARSWLQQEELDPTDRAAREEATRDLDAVLIRFRAIQDRPAHGDQELLDQNIRFRLAQALADRAELDVEGSEPKKRREDEAVKLLERPITEPTLRGFALLLRAELLGRLGRFDPALEAIEAAAKVKPPLPPAGLLAARVEVLIGQKRFADAIKAIESSTAPEAATRDVLAFRVRLAERSSLDPGPDRSNAESALFRRAAALRGSSTPDARRALIDLARQRIEPDGNQGPEAWEAIAAGAVALGDSTRAGRLESKGADRAEFLGDQAQAATLRLRAGAYFYQAENYAEADAVLTRVVDDPKAGAPRAEAGMLRALARGRALGLDRPGSSQKAYVDALESQIRDFPSDPTTNEARWLLGRLRLAGSDRESALALWSAIPPDMSRWIDAQLAVARLNQDDLDTLRIGSDRPGVEASYNGARGFLIRGLDRAQGDADKAELGLALARLELTPLVGNPDDARQRCEDVLHSATQPELRERAGRLRLVALAELNRFLEAEQEARDESARARGADLLDVARLLDHIASESESDLRLRRFGQILRVLLTHALERPEELTEAQVAELRLRNCRSLLFRGDDFGARRALTNWNGRPPLEDDRYLKDLADTYFRLEAYTLAIEVERLRQKHLGNGSLPWFESRYRLALAQYRSGKTKDSLHLIDATAILHPDLGGSVLHEKFVRLRQRMGPPP
jgi:hypothetical protein